ncbi:MAG TPA: hypothetical protein VFA68_10960 [Terriglobales bacterium]|nr:hypothetical protein [Terriglobales bacterium]
MDWVMVQAAYDDDSGGTAVTMKNLVVASFVVSPYAAIRLKVPG